MVERTEMSLVARKRLISSRHKLQSCQNRSLFAFHPGRIYSLFCVIIISCPSLKLLLK